MNRKKLAAAALTASLATGGVAAALTGLPAAIAQTVTGSASAVEGGWFADALSGLVESGTLTQAQADAVRQALIDARPERPGPGHRGFGGPHLEAVAEVIGIDVDALRGALVSGQTVAQVAEANGVSLDTLVEALVADLREHLAGHVTDGSKTQAEADAILAEAPDRIRAALTGEAPFGAHAGPGPRGIGPMGTFRTAPAAGVVPTFGAVFGSASLS